MSSGELISGARFGPSAWVTVSQSRIDAFADATDDHQWIHVDAQRAAEGVFKGTIAHGFLTLSLLPRFVSELVPRGRYSTGLNYGLNRVRFPAPVPSGSRIRASIEVNDVETFDWGAQVTMTATVEGEGGDGKPVCVAQLISRYYL